VSPVDVDSVGPDPADGQVGASRVSIDIDRLWARIEALGEVGAVLGPDGERGSARLALTDADRDGRHLVVAWMRDLGLSIAVDSIGNVVGTRAGGASTATSVCSLAWR
jgi:beta-ureidopropionase / N-carbamoyl-L-amino-acid hydrolase